MTQETMVRSLEILSGEEIVAGLDMMSKQAVTMPPAIPIEQIKGDISRAGHPVQRLMALDPDARRIFFTDVQGSFMYAEFASPEDAYRVTKVGYQAEIIKEYGGALEKAFDPVDLEAEPRDTVATGHEEREVDYPGSPTIIPPGTPGEKPIDLDHDGFGDVSTVPARFPVGDTKDRHEDNSGYNQSAHDEQMKKDLQDTVALGELGGFLVPLVYKQPPRPGLVPQTGDPQHPGRWIRPSGPEGAAPSGGAASRSINEEISPGFTMRARPKGKGYQLDMRIRQGMHYMGVVGSKDEAAAAIQKIKEVWERVHESLDNAVANDYPLQGNPTRQSHELTEDPDLEDIDPRWIYPAVVHWQHENE